MGIAVFKETTTGGYNIGIGYNPFTENITVQIILVLDIGLVGTVWGTTIHFRGSDKTDNLGTYNNSTAIGQQQ
jgi:hypothetical protein